ncbi:MAG: ribosome-associated translation inhibitor RaiA [Burkholderiales bacterium]|jgi:putative sigma-54 modulation protein|nr:ribosome-associated translation inhibitor RaiA [Burkholderiales bacterium]
MNLHLTGHHLQITPAIRDHVANKLEKITAHFDHVIDINVIMTVEKLQHKVEATVHLSGKDIFCEVREEDMYVAIDHLVNKLDRAIIKHKEKHLSHRHDGDALKHQATE